MPNKSIDATLGGTAPSGEIVLARLHFRVLKAATSTIRFSLSDWRCTDLTYQGEPVLGTLAAAEIRGDEAATGHRLWLPAILKNRTR